MCPILPTAEASVKMHSEREQDIARERARDRDRERDRERDGEGGKE